MTNKTYTNATADASSNRGKKAAVKASLPLGEVAHIRQSDGATTVLKVDGTSETRPADPNGAWRDLLDRQVCYAEGKKLKNTAVVNKSCSLREFFKSLSKHPVGEKDGSHVLQGHVRMDEGGKPLTRADANMATAYVRIYDVECGDTVEENKAKLEARNLAAAIYPTFNDMATTTLIAKSKIASDDPKAAAVEYLRTDKRWRERLLDTITDVTLDGDNYRVTHGPLPRHRIVLPLSEMFDFGTAEEHEGGAQVWGASYLSVAEELGLRIDTTCYNPSRLMYLPRRPRGSAERKTIFVKGRALDLSEFKSAAQQPISQRAIAAAGLPARDAETLEPKTGGLKRFLHDHGHNFDAVKFILEGRPDDKVRRNKKRQHVVRCPNEASHTNRDAQHLKSDTACVCDDARGKNGWMLLCQHSGCGFDRAKLLDIECQTRGIKDAGELLRWCPQQEQSPTEDAKTIGRLARLSALELARVVKMEAEKLGVSASDLKAAVKKRRGELKEEASRGPLADPEAWDEEVDGAVVLDAIVRESKRYLVLQPHVAEATALWVVHAHAFDYFDHSPFFTIESPEPECGKTELMSFLNDVVPKPIFASNVSAAAIFRIIERFSPTLLLDEGDTFLEDDEAIRGILNSGHNRKGAHVIRCEGDSLEPKVFSTWSPKAIAKIGKIKPTLRSRSVVVRMKRALNTDYIEERSPQGDAELKRLQSMAWRWAHDHEAELRAAAANIVKPTALRGRKGDNWKPLLAIAAVAGGHWPETAKAAAAALCGAAAADPEVTTTTRLLQDIRLVFDEKGAEAITPTDLLTALIDIPDAPWCEFKMGRPATTRTIAFKLKEFEIASTEATTAYGGSKSRYYVRAHFEDAWKRYLPSQAAEVAPNKKPRPSKPNASSAKPKWDTPADYPPLDGTFDTDALFNEAQDQQH